jgi:hypothetical protein
MAFRGFLSIIKMLKRGVFRVMMINWVNLSWRHINWVLVRLTGQLRRVLFYSAEPCEPTRVAELLVMCLLLCLPRAITNVVSLMVLGSLSWKAITLQDTFKGFFYCLKSCVRWLWVLKPWEIWILSFLSLRQKLNFNPVLIRACTTEKVNHRWLGLIQACELAL